MANTGINSAYQPSPFPVVWRHSVTSLGYLVLFSASLLAAVLIRFDFQPPEWLRSSLVATVASFALVKTLIFLATGQSRICWSHIAFSEVPGLIWSCAVSSLALGILNQLAILPVFMPRSVLLIDFATTVLMAATTRSVLRLATEFEAKRIAGRRKKRALLVGAGNTEKILALALHNRRHVAFHICGFLDEAVRWRGESLGGVPVLGEINELEEIAKRQGIDDVLAISGSLPGKELRDLKSKCKALGLNLSILPPLVNLPQSNQDLTISKIDVDKLLRRPRADLDEALIREHFQSITVAVTGAGGSIGSEICRQLQAFGAQRIILVERSEPSLFEIEQSLRQRGGASEVVSFLGDITDERRMRQMFERHRPSFVFHAAAHKHVPLLESQIGEAVKNNLLGTATLVDMAQEYSVERFVFVSTDKAVNPSSVMGATKRLAENYVMSSCEPSKDRFVAVRFGNVLASAGSVAPIFERQIRRGGPITITHPEMKRFFMTIPEAARLVLQAACVGKGGEIFVLDMGKPVKIVDLARDMIQMAGLPERAVDIEFTGMRPGEKLEEELYFSDEEQIATSHPHLFSARHRPTCHIEMTKCLEEFRTSLYGEDLNLLRTLMKWSPEYSPDARFATLLTKLPTEIGRDGLLQQI